MSEKGILMNGAMVRAIMAGKKTQTRRIMRVQPRGNIVVIQHVGYFQNPNTKKREFGMVYNGGYICSEYQLDDRLYVRETWADAGTQCNDPSLGYVYAATDPEWQTEQIGFRWSPSIHMPRSAARLWLEVLRVWPEIVENISEEDVRAEGFDSKADFLAEMVKIYGDCLKKWCWVTEFKRIEVSHES